MVAPIMDEQLYHYSTEPIGELLTVDPRKESGAYKPSGLWVSVGEEWKEWCEGEGFQINSLRVVSRVWLKLDARILRLSCAADIFRFSGVYGIKTRPGVGLRQVGYDKIDWGKVAEHYQGIIIAPYVWECRLDERTFWYYGWDCASGCIWDARNAVERVEVVQPEIAHPTPKTAQEGA